MSKWVKRSVAALVALAVVCLFSGVAFEQWSRWDVARKHPPPGQLFEVDGHNMHLNCTGSGSPTVILESGLSLYGSLSWVLVQPEIAKTNRICSYDRAGMMWSDRRHEVPTGIEIVDFLHELLQVGSEKPPYVLIGHSLGGPLIIIFANRYPNEVDALVFVDPSHPDQTRRFAKIYKDVYGEDKTTEPEPWWNLLIQRLMTDAGGRRLFALPSTDRIPEKALVAHEYYPQNTHAFDSENAAKRQVYADARAVTSFGRIPSIVLTADFNNTVLTEEDRPEWDSRYLEYWNREGLAFVQGHREISALSQVSEHRIVEGSGHRIAFDAPESVVRATRDVLLMLPENEQDD